MPAQRQKPGIKAHLRKYGITHDDRRRLKNALETLSSMAPSVTQALIDGGLTTTNDGSVAMTRTGLRDLVYGLDEEFR